MASPPPPRLARRFFRAYCHPAFVEDLEGDLEELYRERIRQTSRRRADWGYVRDVLLLFRPAIVRPLTFNRLASNQHPAMFRNYFKTSVRHLRKYRSYTLLNAFGLAVGIAAAIVLFLIVRYERAYDTFHAEYEQIYRLGEQRIGEGETDTYYLTKTPLVPALIETFPEVTNGTRFFSPDHTRLRYREHTANPLVHYVDSGFVDLFDFAVVAGDLKSTLTRAGHIALTQSVADRLFGGKPGLEKVLEVVHDDTQQLVVGAILEDPPANSSLQFEVLVPWLDAPDWLAPDQEGNWYNTFMTAYVKLNPAADLATLEEKLVPFKDQHFTSDDLANLRTVLLPLAELRSEETDNAAVITLLSIIAIITLTIACVNFMNLSTAQSLLRTREIGLRKAIGSRRSQLVGQFLTESTLTAGLALLVGVLLVQLTLPWFNQYFGLDLTFRYWQNLPLLATLLALGVIVGLLSGIYPALFASGMRPVDSLKGKGKHRSGRALQRGLIVLQYAASVLLIVGTLVIGRQIQFMKTQDLNFQQDHVAVVPFQYNDFDFESEAQAVSALQRLKRQLTRETAIQSLAFAENVPGQYNHNYNHFSPSEAPEQTSVSLRQVTVGAGYFRTLGMDIVEGRAFSEELASDSNAVVINQTAMQALGWSGGQDKYLVEGGSGQVYQVVGVVKDFHYQSLQQPIQPLIHFYGGADFVGTLAVRLQPTAILGGLQAIEKTYGTLNPYEPFAYFFLDEEFDRMYQAQERLGLTATLFSGVAVVLASLGLLALAAFAARQRQQEVGVRKVLGASVTQIIVLLSKNFAGLVVIAFVIASPLAYYAARRFLQDFAYRVAITADIFIIAGAVALVVAGLSVSSQAWRAASANPVDALRDE